MQYYVQPPMRCTKYQNSTYSYRDTFAFPSETYLNTQTERVVYPQTVSEFDSFTMRENAISLAFFANSKDPEMGRILKILTPIATNVNKLVVVDVNILPRLGSRFGIDCPTLFKIYKGRVVREFKREFTAECLATFASMPSTARWRQPNIR